MRSLHRPFITILLSLLAMVACVSPRPTELPTVPDTIPDGFPEERYRAFAASGAAVYEINTARTLVQIHAFRDGPMARFGHDHVVASRNVRGFIFVAPEEADKSVNVEADLYAPLAAMSVDEPDLRSAAGFDTEISDSAREGTRANMLASIEAGQFPHVTLNIKAKLESRVVQNIDIVLTATIALHGASRTLETPVRISIDDQTLRAEGTLSIVQSEFGIEPYKALGGALSVRDRLDLQFMLTAERVTAD